MSHGEKRDRVILVDQNDCVRGEEDKLKAHQNGGSLHRAFSIFIFDHSGRMLLQQRASGKYHFADLWTNACCSHPQPGETLQEAVQARLDYEFGFDTKLQEIFSFVYQAQDTRSGLSEYEFDHVFSGVFNGKPQPNAREISDWKWLSLSEVTADLSTYPHQYTPWFRIALNQVMTRWPHNIPS